MWNLVSMCFDLLVIEGNSAIPIAVLESVISRMGFSTESPIDVRRLYECCISFRASAMAMYSASDTDCTAHFVTRDFHIMGQLFR